MHGREGLRLQGMLLPPGHPRIHAAGIFCFRQNIMPARFPIFLVSLSCSTFVAFLLFSKRAFFASVVASISQKASSIAWASRHQSFFLPPFLTSLEYVGVGGSVGRCIWGWRVNVSPISPALALSVFFALLYFCVGEEVFLHFLLALGFN